MQNPTLFISVRGNHLTFLEIARSDRPFETWEIERTVVVGDRAHGPTE